MLWGVPWYYWLILVFAVVLAIFAWSKALSASKLRRERLKKEAAIWQRDYDLRQKFSVLTKSVIDETELTELLHGAAMNIQIALEKESDMSIAFEKLPLQKKYIYTLEYFDEDAKIALSHYFKNNGAPLLPLTKEALAAVGGEKYLDTVSRIYPMYDDESDVSIDYALVEKLDKEFSEIYDSALLCRLCGIYIKNNSEIFLQ